MSSDCCGCTSAGHQMASSSAFRLGIVKEQDLSLGRLRVVFIEFDQMVSYWLPLVVPKTQNDKAYWIPDIGEQVVCLMDAHDEAGVVLGAIYSQPDSTPVQSADKFHVSFKDGATMEYDRSARVMAFNFSDQASIKYDGGAHVMSLNFSDQASMKYDGGAHALTLSFEDQASIKYDAGAHALNVTMSDGSIINYNGAAHMFSVVGVAGSSVLDESRRPASHSSPVAHS